MTQRIPSRRMQPLQQLADIRQDDAARLLVDAQRQHADRQARLVELSRYREDYERQAAAATPQLLRNRQAFLDRLREAERFTEQLVEQSRRMGAESRPARTVQHAGPAPAAAPTAYH